MKMKHLKMVRVFVSLTLFLLFTGIFMGAGFLQPEKISDYAVYFQFVPSLLKFLSTFALASAGFIFVLILTGLFGRVYCSFLCPLGVLQDIIASAGKKLRKIKYGFSGAHSKTRYAILAGVAIAFASGSVAGLLLTDPYSHFGRIFTHIVRPAAIWMNNSLSFVLGKFNIYAVYPVAFGKTSGISVSFGLAVLALLLWMGFFHGRLYCNTICPVGTLLGFLSRFSALQLKFKPNACIKCRACEGACKAGCMDMETATIDYSRCVACYNCISICPTQAVELGRRRKNSAPAALKDAGKRALMAKTAAFIIASGSAAANPMDLSEADLVSTVPVFRNAGITPPGSVSRTDFSTRCTACHLCVTACPTNVLQPAFLEYGILGMMQPRMDYKTSFCSYDCVSCSAVCPTGAIMEQDVDSKKLIQLGKARFIRENCVVYTRKTDCGACAEHCPTKAVRMELDPEINKRVPIIDERFCIGCGACEFACPTQPYKSIYVECNTVHGVAQKPAEKEIIDDVGSNNPFPF